MVVLVAVVLAFTSQSLRSFQKQNEDNDKRQQILRSINVNVSSSEAEAKYNELIKEAFLVNENGEKVEGDAFATDVVKAAAEHQYPVSVRECRWSTEIYHGFAWSRSLGSVMGVYLCR